MLHPIGVDLGVEIASITVAKDQVEPGLLPKTDKFIAMVMVAEGDPGTGQPFADGAGFHRKAAITVYALGMKVTRHGDNRSLGTAPDLLALNNCVKLTFKKFIAKVADADGQSGVIAGAPDRSGGHVGVMFQVQLDAIIAQRSHPLHAFGKMIGSFDKVADGVNLNSKLGC